MCNADASLSVRANPRNAGGISIAFIRATGRRHVIRKLPSGKYRLYSRKIDPKSGKRRNLGTFDTREAAEKHERAVQFFKRKGR
jgi:hypothetical protein